MAKPPKRFLALDIGSTTIKLAEFAPTPSGGLRLLNFHHADLGTDGGHEEERAHAIVEGIRQVMAEKHIRPGPTVVSVSGQQVFTRYTKLPPVDRDKLAEIVRYEAQQNVPIPIEELVWDYQITGGADSGEIEVALVAIKSNLVEELVASVEAARLFPVIVDVAPLALYNCVRYNYGDPEGCVVLADIGGRNTNLVFLEPNKLYSRSFPVGGNAFTQAVAQEFDMTFAKAEEMKKTRGYIGLGLPLEGETEEAARLSATLRSTMNKLEGELRRTINLYKTQMGGSPPKVILLSGATSALPYADQYFREKYPGVTVDYFNPFKNIELAEAVNREELAAVAPFFGEVVGLGLREVTQCQMSVNLLPPSTIAKRRVAARRPWYTVTGLIMLLTLSVWYGYTLALLSERERSVEQTEAEVKAWGDLAKQIAETMAKAKAEQSKIDQLAPLADANDFWNRLLTDLNSRLPEYAWIEKFQIYSTSGAPAEGASPFPVAVGNAYGLYGKGVLDDVRRKGESGAKIVQKLEKDLKESPYLDPNGTFAVDIHEPKQGEVVFDFIIQLALKKPSVL